MFPGLKREKVTRIACGRSHTIVATGLLMHTAIFTIRANITLHVNLKFLLHQCFILEYHNYYITALDKALPYGVNVLLKNSITYF